MANNMNEKKPKSNGSAKTKTPSYLEQLGKYSKGELRKALKFLGGGGMVGSAAKAMREEAARTKKRSNEG